MVGLGKIFGRSVKNFGRPGQFLKVWKKIRNVREKISEKMYGKKSRGSKILATRGRGDFVKFYLAPPKMRVAPQMPRKFRDLAPPLLFELYFLKCKGYKDEHVCGYSMLHSCIILTYTVYDTLQYKSCFKPS